MNGSDALREQAKAALQEGRTDAAIEALSGYLSVAPEDLEARCLLGVAYSERGLHNQAIPTLERVVLAAPGWFAAHYNLGLALQRAGQLEEALAAYERTLLLNPEHEASRRRLDALRPSPSVVGSGPTSPPHVRLRRGIPIPARLTQAGYRVAHVIPSPESILPLGSLGLAPLPVLELYPPREAFARRATATLIDAALILVPVCVAGIAAQILGEHTEAALAVGMPVFFFILVLGVVQSVLEFTTGTSLGRRWMKLRIVGPDGRPPGFWRIYRRSRLRLWSWLLLGAGCFWMFSNPEQQTWHDLWADTRVVKA